MPVNRLFHILRANLNLKRKPLGSGEDTSDYVNNETNQDKNSSEADMINPNTRKEVEYYANLELKQGADWTQIKAAYKQLMKKYHPDLHNNSEDNRKTAEIITGKLNEAYSYFEKKYSKNS